MMRLLVLFFTLFMLMPQAQADDSAGLNMRDWSNLPILHEGRLKPLDSFARVTLKRFSGAKKTKDLSADEWLAISLFLPSDAVNIPVFKIRDAEQYGLAVRKKRLYSYIELAQVIERKKEIIASLNQTKSEEFSEDQKALLYHFENYILYTELLRSLSLILPLNLDGTGKNFLDHKKRQQFLEQKTKDIVSKKGLDLDGYTDEERRVSLLSYQLNLLQNSAQNNILFRIIPTDWEQKNQEWVAPWAIIRDGKGSPQSAKYIQAWQNLAQAYMTQDQTLWDQSVEQAKEFFDRPRLKIETIYNDIYFINWALFFYILTFSILVISHLVRDKIQRVNLDGIALNTFVTAIALHGIHMILRVYILERAPVGTLYESILFVSLICTIGFLFFGKVVKNKTSLLLGSLAGIMLLITANGFSSDDNMGMLVAVLNTNFWLGTHVICITIGYATCFMASLMAHYDLVARYLHKPNKYVLARSFSNIKTILILSLLFTTIGTILGGIWADQSWGRFWGWDPKENGALLIVLWLAWLLHGRISGHLNRLGVIAGTAFLSVIVVVAWFGVNLLNIGLHSYGFIQGVALGIGGFVIFEILIIGLLWHKAQHIKASMR